MNNYNSNQHKGPNRNPAYIILGIAALLLVIYFIIKSGLIPMGNNTNQPTNTTPATTTIKTIGTTTPSTTTPIKTTSPSTTVAATTTPATTAAVTTTAATTTPATTAAETTTPATTTPATTATQNELVVNKYYETLVAEEKPGSIYAEVFESDVNMPETNQFIENGGGVKYHIVPKYENSIVRIYKVKLDASGLPEGPDYNNRLFSTTLSGSGTVYVQAYGDEVFPHFCIVVTTPDERSGKSFSHSDGRGYFDPVYYFTE